MKITQDIIILIIRKILDLHQGEKRPLELEETII